MSFYKEDTSVAGLLKILQKLVEEGHGDALVYVCDTRSGVYEEASFASDTSENVEMASGDVLEKAYAIYLG